MDRGILVQYADMKQRIKLLREKIRRLEKEIDELKETIASDTVRGGEGGLQLFKIEGIPNGVIRRKQFLLESRRTKLCQEELELLELTNEAEEYIQKLESVELRIMFDLYYLQDMTWSQVAMQMNAIFPKRKIKYTEENCRQRNKRFFDKF